MKSSKRIYLSEVLDTETREVKEVRLVRHTHPDRASAHVAKDLIRVRVATPDDIVQNRHLEIEDPTAPVKPAQQLRILPAEETERVLVAE